MQAKIIRIEEETVMPYQFEGKVTKVITMLQSLVDRYGENVELDWKPNFYEPYDPEPTPLFEVMSVRPETPEEVQERLGNEARRAELTRLKELELLATLKAKWEGQ